MLDLLRLLGPLAMLESETPGPCLDKGGLDQEIEKLHSVLDANYSAAEKIMSLRDPNFKQLEKVMREVNDNSSKLIEMVKNADDESATITPFGLTQSKQKFNERVKQWLRDVPQTSGVDNETKTVVPEESGLGGETKTVPYDENQPNTAQIENDFYKDVHDNSSTMTTLTSKTRTSSTSAKISVKRMQAQERLKIAQLQASQLDELAEEENAQFELEFELMRRKNELMRRKNEEERRKNELKLEEDNLKLQEERLKLEEERRKNELKQQIRKREALRRLEMASVQCEVWSETGSVKSFKRDTAPRPKIEIPFAIRTAEHNTKLTCLVKEKPCNVFKSVIQTDTAGSQTAVPKADAVKLANFPQENNSATTIKKASSSILTATAPEFRPGTSTVLPKNRVTRSTEPKGGVEPESNSFVNYNRQSFPAPTFPFPWQTNLSYESLFLPRPEFAKFSDDPLEFKNFLGNFETHVESRVTDQNTSFCLLVQHCTDPIKDKIKHFSEKGELCYQSAKQRLIKEYGSPWVVSDVCEQKLKSFPLIKHGDTKELKRFADLLDKTFCYFTKHKLFK